VTYEPEALKFAWDQLVAEAGARVLHHARLTAVVTDERRVVGVIVETKAGPRRISATSFVDATGDAELAWRAGASVDRPSNENRVQPLTATFRLGGVDVRRASTKELHRLMAEAADSGRYDLLRREGSSHRTMLDGVVHTNLTRVLDVDATEPWQLSDAEQEGRRQVREYMRFLVEQVPGYENAYLLGTSVWIGVRETRRLHGRYVLTREDVLGARDFPDAVARCGAPLEDHAGGESTIWEYVGANGGPTRADVRDPLPQPLPRGARQRARGRTLPVGDTRRPRVRAIDGPMHGDGAGRRDCGRDRDQRRRRGRRHRHRRLEKSLDRPRGEAVNARAGAEPGGWAWA
jgi:hypothetical protein